MSPNLSKRNCEPKSRNLTALWEAHEQCDIRLSTHLPLGFRSWIEDAVVPGRRGRVAIIFMTKNN